MYPFRDAFEYYLERYKVAVTVAVLLTLGVIIGVGVLGARMTPPLSTEEPPTIDGEAIRTGSAAIPEYTAATAAKLAASGTFFALISYTDHGFEPRQLTVTRGDRVRFTNNSSHDVWIASGGPDATVYPRSANACGSSNLDTCAPLPPMDFWEFTFDTPGVWGVLNNLEKSERMIVVVESE
jgi:plastocyanin